MHSTAPRKGSRPRRENRVAQLPLARLFYAGGIAIAVVVGVAILGAIVNIFSPGLLGWVGAVIRVVPTPWAIAVGVPLVVVVFILAGLLLQESEQIQQPGRKEADTTGGGTATISPPTCDEATDLDQQANDPKWFCGREEEIKEILEVVDKPRGSLIAVTGLMGYGKTAIVAECVRQVRSTRTEDQWATVIIQVANDTQDASSLAYDIINNLVTHGQAAGFALPAEETRLKDRLTALRTILALRKEQGKRTLIVLDSIDLAGMPAKDASVSWKFDDWKPDVVKLLQTLSGAGASVIITSYDEPPARLITKHIPIDEPLLQQDAYKLMVMRLPPRLQPNTPEDRREIGKICEMATFVPGNICWAAKNADRIARSLTHYRTFLASQTLPAAYLLGGYMQSIYGNSNRYGDLRGLPAPAKDLFTVLGALQSPRCDVETVYALGAMLEPALSKESVDEHLNALAKRYIINIPWHVRRHQNHQSQITCKEDRHEYAKALFQRLPSQRRQEIRTALARDYAQKAVKVSDAVFRGPAGVFADIDPSARTRTTELLQEYEPNLSACLSWALDAFSQPDHAGAVEVIVAMFAYALRWYRPKGSDEEFQRKLLEQGCKALTALRGVDKNADKLAYIYYALGEMRIGQPDLALDAFQHSQDFFAQSGNPQGQAAAQKFLGDLAQRQGDNQNALWYYDEGLRKYPDQTLEETIQQARVPVLMTLGEIAQRQGDHQGAIAYYRASLDALQRFKNPRLETIIRQKRLPSLRALGDLAQRQGDYRNALAYYQDCLRDLQQYKDPLMEAATRQALASLLITDGQAAQ